MKEIHNQQELLDNLKEDQKTYLLLYKSGSEISECAYKSLSETATDYGAINILHADVNKVRDVHSNYGITSAPSLLVFEGKKFSKSIKGCSTTDFYKSLFESTLFMAAASEGKPQKNVTVYSTPTCSWCNTLKSHLRKHRIYFTDVDVSSDPSLAEELVRKSGQQGVPQTEIDGEIIVGFDKKRINSLLGIQG